MAQPQTTETDWRNQEIKIDPFVYQLAAGIFLIIIATLIGFALFPNDKGYLTNLYTTGIGVLITIAFLDRRAERREAARAEADLKARLIREFGSKSNVVAIRAAEELSAKTWLYDGSLKHKLFRYANLEEAYLLGANLEGSDLLGSNLKDTDLRRANLQNSFLRGTSLQGARLASANLQGSDLETAYLQQVSLMGANLQEVNLKNCQFDENTVLPNYAKWTPNTDMTRFTDPNHPRFWRSDDPASPAYRGKTSE